jgi:hypothetical protein
MSPDKKMKWFKDHGRSAAEIRRIKKLVVDRWNKGYEGEDMPPVAAQHQGKVSLNIGGEIHQVDIHEYSNRQSPNGSLQLMMMSLRILMIL